MATPSASNKQSRQLWTIDWAASGFSNNSGLYVLAPTPIEACRKAIKYLRAEGYVRPSIKAVKHAGEIDVF